MKLRLIGLCLGVIVSSSYGCGCVDAPEATQAMLRINKNFAVKDSGLAEALQALGSVLKESYDLQNQAALDEERIARLKKAQAEVLEQIAFDEEKLADLFAKGNEINAKNAELNLIRLEQAGIFKNTLLNKIDLGE